MAILALVASLCLITAPARADDRDRLVQVGLQGRVVQLVADADGTCALTEAGDVFCWSAGDSEPSPSGSNPLLLVTVGALLVAGGMTLLMLSRK